jgi:hypothetical protein
MYKVSYTDTNVVLLFPWTLQAVTGSDHMYFSVFHNKQFNLLVDKVEGLYTHYSF